MQNRKQTIYQYISRTLGSLCTLNFQRHFLHILSNTECIFFLFPEKAFSLFCLRKAHKPFRNQKYLKCLFLSPNQGIERNRHILTELGEYIFCLCPLSLSNKECKKKNQKGISINYKREEKTNFFLERHAYQTPLASKFRNICAESIILLAQILKEFILHLPILVWTFQNSCNNIDI